MRARQGSCLQALYATLRSLGFPRGSGENLKDLKLRNDHQIYILETGKRVEKIVIWGKVCKTKDRKLGKAVITRVIIQARSNQGMT